jgi:hypothetical protein
MSKKHSSTVSRRQVTRQPPRKKPRRRPDKPREQQLTDEQLGKYSYLNEFEKQTGVSKVYVVLGLGAMYFFLVFFNVAAEFLVNTIGFIIPAYYSLNALFTAGTADDTQWLTVCFLFLRG